ncbi:hypothetical protein ACIPIC_18380 [Streptomyces collinus]|uniref:hypothetical protein n=1 Tax=Streptomyces collinus TaxID=42684 RepID=UPI00381FF2F6
MAIQPIETRYAGHHFRSRLEARWAVLFDALGIRWEYEPQGYRVGPDRKPYLPDFWLPKERLWVEVKGAEEQLDVELLVHAALLDTGLPRPTEPHVVSEHEARILVLGPLGRGVTGITDKTTKAHVGYMQPLHTAVTIRKGDIFQSYAWFTSNSVAVDPTEALMANDGPQIYWDTRGSDWGNLVGGGGLLSDDVDMTVADAYRRALSARFEHGQSGA